MDLLNQIGIDTTHGMRLVELYHGDLMDLSDGTDVLVLSSLNGSYYPTPGTVIEAIQRRFGIRVVDLSRNPYIDLRPGLRTWISHPLKQLPFGRLACVETPFRSSPASTLLSDAFIALTAFEAKGVEASSVALPVLGAGRQGLPPIDVAQALVQAVGFYLKRSLVVKTVRIVCSCGPQTAVRSGRFRRSAPKTPDPLRPRRDRRWLSG